MTNVEKIHEIAGYVDGEVRDNYSGRGMFGRTCYGIDCDDPNEAIEEAGRLGLRGARVDNMGKGYIVYWPDVQGVGSRE